MKTLIKLLSLTALVMLIVTLASASVTAAGEIEIANAQDFLAISNDLEADYKLISNIDFSGVTFTPIGSLSTPFAGNFDGAGFTISGVTYQGDAYCALFASNIGNIQNFTLNGANISANADATVYAAAICAINDGTIDEITVESSTISATSTSFASRAAGIVAFNGENGTVSNCKTTSTVEVNSTSDSLYAHSGGICAVNMGVIINCETAAQTTSLGAKTDAVSGGVAGESSGNVDTCVSNGTSFAKAESVTVYANKGVALDFGTTSNITGTGTANVDKIPGGYYILGDVTGDEKVNLEDTVYLARFVAGWTEYDLEDEECADVTSDGLINLEDTIYLARFVAGWTGYTLE